MEEEAANRETGTQENQEESSPMDEFRFKFEDGVAFKTQS
jgi:hypothetical protein